MATQEIISIREYARRIGCSDVAVGHAIKKGQIVKGVVRKPNGKPRGIIPEIADKEWGENRRPTYKRNEKLERHLEATEAGVDPQAPDAQAAPPLDDGGPKKSVTTMAEANRAKAILDAKIKELDYKERLGQLVDKGKVYRALFAAGHQLRAAVMAVPDRVIDDIRAEPDRNKAHALLFTALSEALESMTEIQQRDITI